MSKFLPTNKFTLKTKLSKETVLERLEGVTEPRKLIRFRGFGSKFENDYEGTIGQETFALRRLINYKNSFLPEIGGKFRSDLGGTKVDLTFNMHPFVNGFLVLWVLFFSVGGFFMVTSIQEGYSIFNALPIAFILLFYGVILAVFKYEVKKGKNHLLELFEATIES